VAYFSKSAHPDFDGANGVPVEPIESYLNRFRNPEARRVQDLETDEAKLELPVGEFQTPYERLHLLSREHRFGFSLLPTMDLSEVNIVPFAMLCPNLEYGILTRASYEKCAHIGLTAIVPKRLWSWPTDSRPLFSK
jgi:hypothetical protein